MQLTSYVSIAQCRLHYIQEFFKSFQCGSIDLRSDGFSHLQNFKDCGNLFLAQRLFLGNPLKLATSSCKGLNAFLEQILRVLALQRGASK